MLSVGRKQHGVCVCVCVCLQCLRPVWMALRERVTAIDELNMAVCRMRLREADEPVVDPPPSNIVEPLQVS